MNKLMPKTNRMMHAYLLDEIVRQSGYPINPELAENRLWSMDKSDADESTELGRFLAYEELEFYAVRAPLIVEIRRLTETYGPEFITDMVQEENSPPAP